jgi:hypothetical protein
MQQQHKLGLHSAPSERDVWVCYATLRRRQPEMKRALRRALQVENAETTRTSSSRRKVWMFNTNGKYCLLVSFSE